MKTLIYSLLVFSLILSTSCSKENSLVPDVKPEQTFTAANLAGNWNFVSLKFQNRTISGYDAEFQKTLDFVTLGFREVTATSLKLYCDCSVYLSQGEGKLSEWSYNYSLSNNELNIDNGYIKFTILSASTTKLELKLTAGNKNMPIGGIYTLIKQ